LLHGFAGDATAWSDVMAAWPASAAAALELRAIDLPGHGTDAGPVRATWDANIAAVGERVRGCDLVIGYSLGARVALGLIASGFAPRAILIGVNPGLADDDPEREMRRVGDARWATLLRERGTAAFAEAWSAQPLFATQTRAPAERRARRLAARLALDPEQLARSLEVMGLAEMPDYRGALRVHAAKLSLLAGAEDAKYVALGRAIAKSAPIAFETIADSGHDPTLEQPIALAAALARLA
jgi:2-succinyl-6-hydroxy-2,4-cyclohexadiene-1-carboxylate synthase